MTRLKDYKHLLAPITEEIPCGVDLEYEQEFLLLFNDTEPKAEVEYGDFKSDVESVNWGELITRSEALLLKSKDLRIQVVWTRAQMNVSGAEGLARGLELIYRTLNDYPKDVFPLIEVEHEYDEIYRSNTFSSLNDSMNFLKDLRQIYIIRSGPLKLQVKDIEKTFSMQRGADALVINSVVQQLNELYEKENTELLCLSEAYGYAHSLQKLLSETFKDIPTHIDDLLAVLVWFSEQPPLIMAKNGLFRSKNLLSTQNKEEKNRNINHQHKKHTKTNILDAKEDSFDPPPSVITETQQQNRQQIRIKISQARMWLIENEPSSPAILLLSQAENLIGKPFEQVFDAIPFDLIEKWTSTPETS